MKNIKHKRHWNKYWIKNGKKNNTGKNYVRKNIHFRFCRQDMEMFQCFSNIYKKFSTKKTHRPLSSKSRLPKYLLNIVFEAMLDHRYYISDVFLCQKLQFTHGLRLFNFSSTFSHSILTTLV